MNLNVRKGLSVKTNTIFGHTNEIASKLKVNLPLIFQIK